MNRRALLAVVGSANALRPITGVGQEKRSAALGRTRRVGFMAPGSPDSSTSVLDPFREGLRLLGWEEGGNLAILDRWAEGQTERLSELAGKLIGADVDVLVTAGTAATYAASRRTSRVPIVMVGVGDPVGLGVVSSLARPGGNVTGLSLDSGELITMRLQLLRDIVPNLSRLAVIVRNDPGLGQRLVDIETIAGRLGIKVRGFEASTGQALQLAFIWLINDHSDAICVASGPLGPAKRAEIIALAAKARIPAIYPFRGFPAAGGLMSFGADEAELFRRAANFVA